jgi:anaerobic selenocysteine-containing dehydrogenase
MNKFNEGDWALITSRHGSIKVPVARMDALNENTIWTWNAIGKRRGAWALEDDATESNKGFLLNHIIHELLPPKKDGMRWSNSDPITGQAAWFDLRVKIEKVEIATHVEPFPSAQKSPVGSAPKDIKYGKEFND